MVVEVVVVVEVEVVEVVVVVERLAGRKRMQQVFCEEAHAEALAIAIVIVEIRLFGCKWVVCSTK